MDGGIEVGLGDIFGTPAVGNIAPIPLFHVYPSQYRNLER